MLKNELPPIYIYALINPINNLVFYVGATADVKKRLSSHKTDRYISKSKKSLVLREIIESGIDAEILILDVCYGEEPEIRFYEEFYIELMRSWGFYLPQLSQSKYKRYVPNTIDAYFKNLNDRLIGNQQRCGIKLETAID